MIESRPEFVDISWWDISIYAYRHYSDATSHMIATSASIENTHRINIIDMMSKKL